MKNKQQPHPLEPKLQKATDLLEHFIAIEMYKGGATQPDVATSLGISVGKVNRLVKGIKTSKEDYGKDKENKSGKNKKS